MILLDALIRTVTHVGCESPLANCRVDGTYGLANNHQVMDHPDLDQRTAIEGCPALHLFDLDLADGIQDVL